jgi:Ca-activated chloride channel family protein
MFRFETPEYLYLLLLLPVLAVMHYLWAFRKRRNLRKYGDPVLLKSFMPDVSPLRTELKFWFLQLSLLFLIIALARPQYGTRVDTRKRSGIEAIIAIDVSNSMLAEDVRPNRLEKAKMMVSNLVDNMTDDKIGLIVYAGQVFRMDLVMMSVVILAVVAFAMDKGVSAARKIVEKKINHDN